MSNSTVELYEKVAKIVKVNLEGNKHRALIDAFTQKRQGPHMNPSC